MKHFVEINAERKIYGLKEKITSPMEDCTPEALVCWEVLNKDIFSSKDVISEITHQRQRRYNISTKLKALQSIVRAIEKAR